MARGFVAGFLKRDGKWHRHWVDIDAPGQRRDTAFEQAKGQLAELFGVYCGGAAVARRKMIFVDGLCPDGRELFESIFEAIKHHESPPETPSEESRRED